MKNTTGIITEIKTLATHDGPGIRTTVFTKGCPLRCRWCSNPETQERHPELYFIANKCQECGECVKVCPEQVISMNKDRKIDRNRCTLCMRCVEACKYGAMQKMGREITPEELCEKVAEDYPFYVRSGGGITVSGGEPLYQPDFTAEVFELCHRKGISNVLDTCGYASPKDVGKVIKHADLILLDIKHMDPIKHKKWTNVECELILENAELMARECETRISLPLVPGFNDEDENIRQTIEFAASLGVECIDILPFHKLGTSKYEFLGRRAPFSDFGQVSDEKVREVLEMVESYGLKTTKGRSM